MPRQANTKRASCLWALVLLASSTGGLVADGPAGGASATACLKMESRPAAAGTLGCLKFVLLRNSCEAPVVAQVRRTQHLFSGTLRDAFPILVPPGAEQQVGCAWWSGATAPAGYELLAAGFLPAPTRTEPKEHDCSNQR